MGKYHAIISSAWRTAQGKNCRTDNCGRGHQLRLSSCPGWRRRQYHGLLRPGAGRCGIIARHPDAGRCHRPLRRHAEFFGIPGGAVDVIIAPLSGRNDGSGGACHRGCDFTAGGAPYLGELTQLVPFEMAGEALAQTRTVQSRVRDVPSRVVVYLVLAACLFPELGYPGVWRKLTAGLAGVPVAAPTPVRWRRRAATIGPPLLGTADRRGAQRGTGPHGALPLPVRYQSWRNSLCIVRPAGPAYEVGPSGLRAATRGRRALTVSERRLPSAAVAAAQVCLSAGQRNWTSRGGSDGGTQRPAHGGAGRG